MQCSIRAGSAYYEEDQTMKGLFIVAMCFFIAGCAAAPPVLHDVRSDGAFDAKYDWTVRSVKEFFEKEKIPVIKGNDDSGLIETEEIKVPYEGFQYSSDYCDCGAPGGLYVYREILGKFSAFLKKTDDGKTAVHIGASYRASLWRYDTFIGWVECQSKGYVENKLIEHVNTALNKDVK